MKFVLAGLATVTALGIAIPAQAQRSFDEIEIRTEQVAPGLAVLFAVGGNIGVSYGQDGTILIDDQFAPLTDKIAKAVSDLGASPVKFVVNTHWHYDHTGGNENLGKSGALIFAHDNVRARLIEGGTAGEMTILPAPAVALPVVTYGEGVSFHQNGYRAEVVFTGGGHTDGDSIVIWHGANVVHLGDLYFNIPGYPFIDTTSGGNVLNAMASLDAAIRIMDDDTKVIPGHGPMSNKAELVTYRQMIGEAVDRVEALRAEGMDRAQVIAANPLNDFDRGEGFIDANAFVGAIFDSLESRTG